jgi:RNA polymerase sigma-70 factor (ECF subfamily)
MSEFDEDPGVRWMLAWKEGDEAAFDRIVETYSPQVYALLTRFLGSRPNREDLVQETFLRVIRSRERYEPSARFTTWLFRIVYHLAVNETQRKVAREPLALESFGTSGRGPGRSEEGSFDIDDERAISPSASLERQDLVTAVRAAIALLPDNQRMALILARYEERPYAEIATILGSTEKAVKSLIHRSREALRESLAPYIAEETS